MTRIRKHTNKGAQPANILNGAIRPSALQLTFEQIQSGSGSGATPGATLVNYIWATLINK